MSIMIICLWEPKTFRWFIWNQCILYISLNVLRVSADKSRGWMPQECCLHLFKRIIFDCLILNSKKSRTMTYLHNVLHFTSPFLPNFKAKPVSIYTNTSYEQRSLKLADLFKKVWGCTFLTNRCYTMKMFWIDLELKRLFPWVILVLPGEQQEHCAMWASRAWHFWCGYKGNCRAEPNQPKAHTCSLTAGR